MADISVKSSRIGEIPVLEYNLEDGICGKPALLVYHGWTGKKEDNASLSQEFAREGFFVIAVDAAGHGERKKDDVFIGLPEAMVKSAAEIDLIIAHYRGDKRTDASNTGFIGLSMGGGIALKYLAESGKNLKAVVSVITTPEWGIVQSTPEGLAALKTTYGAHFSEEAAACERRYALAEQPLLKYKAMAGTPLLLLNGEDDQLIPAHSVMNFYKLLTTVSAADDLKLVLYSGVGHDVVPAMVTEAVKWLRHYLIKLEVLNQSEDHHARHG